MLYTRIMAAKRSSSVVDSFLSGELAGLTGLSKHMVDYLCRHGLLSPSSSNRRGYGQRRMFGFTDVLVARSIKQLLDADVSVLNMRRSLTTLRDKLHVQSAIAFTDTRIVIRGGTPYLSEPHLPPIDLTAGGQMAFCFVLEVADLRKRAEALQDRRKKAHAKQSLRATKFRSERIA
jgi:DNA-binding transcriptional MerR regulator